MSKLSDGEKKFWGRHSNKKGYYELTENVIRYAMKNSRSNAEAARFLNVGLQTYKTYAKSYIDKITGLNLYELHKNPKGIGVEKGFSNVKGKKKIENLTRKRKVTSQKILNNKYPNLRPIKIFRVLVKDGYIDPVCHYCGMSQYRMTDKKYPLRLVFLNGDKTDRSFENMRVVCFNCYFLYMDDFIGRGHRNRQSKKKRELGDIDEERQMSSAANSSVIYDDTANYNN